eukprot:9233986-Karenia_brevis.AAC.1
MMNGKRFDRAPSDWTKSDREWEIEIRRFKQLILDTHQAHRALRNVVLPDGPPTLQPASRGFHSTFLKFARQFQSWFTSVHGSVHLMPLDEPGIGRFRGCGKPWMIPLSRLNEGDYP